MTGPKTDENGKIQKREPASGSDLLVDWTKKYRTQLQLALPKHIPADRMMRVVMSAIRQTEGLGECTPPSFIACMLQCAQLGLEPNTPLGMAYLIPRWNNRGGPDRNQRIRECTVVIGYQGYMDLSYRSGMVDWIEASEVRESDLFDYQLGLDRKLNHKPSDERDGEITHAYAVARMRSGGTGFIVLNRGELDERMRRSDGAFKRDGTPNPHSPWHQHHEAMCRKSAIRALWKNLPKSASLLRAQALETAVESYTSPTLDPEVQEPLARHGLLVEGEGDEPAERG